MTETFISLELAINEIYERARFYDAEWGGKRFTEEDVEEILKSLPAADVRPVVKGEWQEGEFKYLTCFVCGCDTCLYDLHGFPIGQSKDFHKPQFCPHCGADMREEEP